jgi:hypothetical protein
VKYRLVVRPEVDANLLQAEAWYEKQQAGLGREFLGEVRKAIARLPQNPLLHPIVIDANKFAGFTRTGFLTESSSE